MKKLFFICCLIISTTAYTYAQAPVDKLIRQGVSLHDKGKYADAVACYRAALDLMPNSMPATYEMSLSYLWLKDYANAIQYSSEIIRAGYEPLLTDAYIVKSTALAESKRLDECIELLNEAIERCGDEYLLHFNLGLTYFNQKNNKMAIEQLQKAIEIDATHSSAFLMYAYALNDSGEWLKSFLAYHFFLLLEPNTERSKEAFSDMMDIISANIPVDSPLLLPEDGVNRKLIYNNIKSKQPISTQPILQYKFFVDASRLIFFTLSELEANEKNNLLWDFFVPTYNEILNSNYFDVYCRYVSVAAYPESLEWWNSNKEKVDDFIDWFERGKSGYDETIEGGEDEI